MKFSLVFVYFLPFDIVSHLIYKSQGCVSVPPCTLLLAPIGASHCSLLTYLLTPWSSPSCEANWFYS